MMYYTGNQRRRNGVLYPSTVKTFLYASNLNSSKPLLKPSRPPPQTPPEPSAHTYQTIPYISHLQYVLTVPCSGHS